jgi:hypothetical protein
MKRGLCCMLGLGCVMVTGLHAQTRPEAPTPAVQVSAAWDQEAVTPHGASATPEPESVPVALARQRQDLGAQREAILALDAQQQVACWQKFAVNACLSQARRVRRQALEPIRQQELVLNAQERDWRTAEREQRLLDKQPAPKDKP